MGGATVHGIGATERSSLIAGTATITPIVEAMAAQPAHNCCVGRTHTCHSGKREERVETIKIA